MTVLRSKQKTPYTPAFVGGVLFFLLSLALVFWFASGVVHMGPGPAKCTNPASEVVR